MDRRNSVIDTLYHTRLFMRGHYDENGTVNRYYYECPLCGKQFHGCRDKYARYESQETLEWHLLSDEHTDDEVIGLAISMAMRG